MTLKSYQIPALGRSVKMGRRRPVAPCPRLSLSNYLLRSLPAPPASVDYTQKAQGALGRMYKNDQLGDCVIAAILHVIGVLTGNADGTSAQFTDDQAVQLYSAVGGYVPGNESTDQGCNEQDALNYWQRTGAPAGQHKILGWLAVNPQDQNECRTALWLFENLYFGLELPDSYTRIQESGFTWGAGNPNPENGHAVAGCGFDQNGVTISTWGMLGTFLWGALQSIVTNQYGGELYTVVSADAINSLTKKAPNGFDLSQLVADFDSLGGNVPVPAPTPAPPPPPAPSPPPVPPPTPAPPPPPAPPSLPTPAQWAAEFARLETRYARWPAYMAALRFAKSAGDVDLGGRGVAASVDWHRILQLVEQYGPEVLQIIGMMEGGQPS